MIKLPDNISRVIILILGVVLIAFNFLIYNSYEKQKDQLNAMKDKQTAEAEINNNKFKDQQDQIGRIHKDLENAQEQMKDQKEALLQEDQGVQRSLVDIKAEADAIKQNMIEWQKDQVSILIEFEKKIDAIDIPDLQENIKLLKVGIEKLSHSADNSTSTAPEVQKHH